MKFSYLKNSFLLYITIFLGNNHTFLKFSSSKISFSYIIRGKSKDFPLNLISFSQNQANIFHSLLLLIYPFTLLLLQVFHLPHQSQSYFPFVLYLLKLILQKVFQRVFVKIVLMVLLHKSGHSHALQ